MSIVDDLVSTVGADIDLLRIRDGATFPQI